MQLYLYTYTPLLYSWIILPTTTILPWIWIFVPISSLHKRGLCSSTQSIECMPSQNEKEHIGSESRWCAHRATCVWTTAHFSRICKKEVCFISCTTSSNILPDAFILFSPSYTSRSTTMFGKNVSLERDLSMREGACHVVLRTSAVSYFRCFLLEALMLACKFSA